MLLMIDKRRLLHRMACMLALGLATVPGAALAAFDPPDVQLRNLARDLAAALNRNNRDPESAAFWSNAAALAIRSATPRTISALKILRARHSMAIGANPDAFPMVSHEITRSGVVAIHVEGFTNRFPSSPLQSWASGLNMGVVKLNDGGFAEVERVSLVLTHAEARRALGLARLAESFARILRGESPFEGRKLHTRTPWLLPEPPSWPPASPVH